MRPRGRNNIFLGYCREDSNVFEVHDYVEKFFHRFLDRTWILRCRLRFSGCVIEDVSFKLRTRPIYESLEYAVQGKGASMSCNHKFYICIFQELFHDKFQNDRVTLFYERISDHILSTKNSAY